jgi:hypothetical protein
MSGRRDENRNDAIIEQKPDGFHVLVDGLDVGCCGTHEGALAIAGDPQYQSTTFRLNRKAGGSRLMPKDFRLRHKIDGQFAPRTIRMLESPAYRVLSLSAHRVLARLEIELAHHGGYDNGELPVTYSDFIEYGIHPQAIPLALRECVALGFVEITERGQGGNREFRQPSKYRLTYRPVGRARPTNEWQRTRTIGDAELLARQARAKQNFRVGKRRVSGLETNPENSEFQGETTVRSQGWKPTLLSKFSAPPGPVEGTVVPRVNGQRRSRVVAKTKHDDGALPSTCIAAAAGTARGGRGVVVPLHPRRRSRRAASSKD